MFNSVLGYLSSFQSMLLLAFGFGFVIFWHELGHFLAAKWADVKVEQFAVGFGPAMLSYRKGLGFGWGSTQEDYHKRLASHFESKTPQAEPKALLTPTEAQLSTAAAELGISETEYRLNWIPLGGYVKMLGQDDLKPGQVVADPRSYNNKTIGQRMVIVSAGVIMNVILAAIGFIYIFTVGFEVTQPLAGLVIPGSPAQNAYKLVGLKHVITPIRVGDKIVSLNGKPQSDFDKIKLNTALLIAGDPVPVDVQHPDGSIEHLIVTPQKSTQGSDFPMIGMADYPSLKGPPLDSKDIPVTGAENPEFRVIKRGDTITAVAGQPTGAEDYFKLYDALQNAAGKPVPVTIRHSDGTIDNTQEFKPHFVDRFDGDPVNFAGMQMLARIDVIQANSPLLGKLQPGDVIVNITDPGPSGGMTLYPTRDQIQTLFNAAGATGTPMSVTVLRDGKELGPFTEKPTVKLQNNKYGFGVQLSMDEADPVVAQDPIDGSPARAGNVPAGATIVAVNGAPVHSWFDVENLMKNLKADQPIVLSTMVEGKPKIFPLKGLSDQELAGLRGNCLYSLSREMLFPDEYFRKARNLWEAGGWGVEETRDAILQVKQTVVSMVKGSISVKEVSGPVGILTAGYLVAQRGTTRLVWFLSIISANLAVMNFLPIPIVDGGLFTFLIIEKIKGSPISQRTQAIAQVVGLALLLSVFLFATYQDVFTRLPILFR